MRVRGAVWFGALLLSLLVSAGCAVPRGESRVVHSAASAADRSGTGESPALGDSESTSRPIRRVAFQDRTEDSAASSAPTVARNEVVAADAVGGDQSQARPSADIAGANTTKPDARTSADVLIAAALRGNPRLQRLAHEYQAAAARSQYADKLPDPQLGANVFGDPIETASGSQRASLRISQAIPWLERLGAEQQKACFEALAIQAEYAAERLRIIAGIRVGLSRLYVLDRQIETTHANRELLDALIDVANAGISRGNGSPGDVLLGTLELSRLEERLLTLNRQRRGVEAEINRLIGRSGDPPVDSPSTLSSERIDLDATAIRDVALRHQPELTAARLRTQAAHWGIEVARLRRRPEFVLSASHFFTDDNRPASPVVHVGEDPWALGVQVSIPVWHRDYDALQCEAVRRHDAARGTVAELTDRYEALIVDLLAEAQRAADTANLYESTILPQARQTLAADQESYSNGSIEFDRVIRDYRSLLTLELGYHQAVGELAMANARLRQAAGRDLPGTAPDASR